MKRISALVLLAVSGVALADGKPAQYDQAIVNQMSLDPNEAVVNDDGAIEDPTAKMSSTARAFRNGVFHGRRMQKEQDDASNTPPPLPPSAAPANRPARIVAQDDQSTYTRIPPQPRLRTQYDPQDGGGQYAPPQPYGAYQQYTPDYSYNERPAQPPVNVYVSPQAPYYQVVPRVYTPPPGPPESTYVIIPGLPPALATGYWPRGYRPPQQYIPQPYIPRPWYQY